MNLYKVYFHVFFYIVLVFPLNDVLCLQQRDTREKVHQHKQTPPCSNCPRSGRCVPRIQCPALLRPGSHSPECHLDGGVGVCCFTGGGHASESDHKLRATSSLPVEDLKTAHHYSRKKLEEWLNQADKLLVLGHNTVVNSSAPSFAHHLSMVTYDKRAQELGQGALLNLFAAQDLRARQAISDDELALGLTDHADGPYCPPPPYCPSALSRYRTFGGECNNLEAPTWGASNTGFERILPPDYSDGVWSLKASSSGLLLPSARSVSAALLPDGSRPSLAHNLLLMQFGQFITHDVSAGVVFTIGNGSAISCCMNDGEDFLPIDQQHWGCAPIASDPNDSFFGQYKHKCMNFVRTQLAPASDCSIGYAKQMNGATHFLDLSHLYGTTKEKIEALKGPGGLLKVFNDYGRELPPLTNRKECLMETEGAACFESGDNHGNQIISLTVLHTIFTREHNRVARALTRFNPDWSEETIFLETRRILQAEFQHVLFSEWLPQVLGPQILQLFYLAPSQGYSASYDPRTNPSITTEFSSAAMRFGHSTIDGKLILPSLKKSSAYESISIPEVMFQPSRLRLKYFLDRLINGMSWQPMQSVDPLVSEGLTHYLFHGGNPFGLDLASINIQRSRDWGVRSYNHYRRLIGLEPYNDFGQYTPSAAQRLSSVYSSQEDVDLWIGGLLEEAIPGAVVGPTFANIIADQFSKLKRGDRYFYENGPDVNPGAFTPAQLAEIKKVTLSRILCDNSDHLEHVTQSPNAFLRADLPGNEPVPCGSPAIPSMDLSRFKEV